MLSAISLLSLCLIGQVADTSRFEKISSVNVPPLQTMPSAQQGNGEAEAESAWHTPGVEGAATREGVKPLSDSSDTLQQSGKSQAARPAEEMLREMLGGLPKTNLAGERLTLLTAVSASKEPRQQQLIINAYWRLFEATLVRQIRQDSTAFLKGLSAPADKSALLPSALASAAARAKDAEVAMTAIQYELAALLERPSDAPLPLPADAPHTGDYRTRFSEAFRGRSAPPIAVQLDRTLPLYRDAIGRRLTAFAECDKALQAALADWQAQQASLADVLAAARETARQREAFLAAVMRYNFSIADYAFATSAPLATPEAIVGMLIKPPYDLGAPVPTNNNLIVDPGVRPAGFNEIAPVQPVRPNRSGVPTPANPETRPVMQGDLPLGLRAARMSVSPQSPVAAPSSGRTTYVHKPIVQEAPAANAGDSFRDSTNQDSAKAIAPGKESAKEAPADSTGKNGLARQVGNMTNPATWIDAEGPPVTLAACLAVTRGDRRMLVEAYWLASRRAIEYSLLTGHVQRIRSLQQAVERTAISQQQRLKASVLISEAAAFEWKAVWLEAQCRLAAQLGREREAAWPVPATPMPSSAIDLPSRFDASSPADLWRLKRMAVAISDLESTVVLHGFALDRASAARTEAFAAAQGESVGAALQSASAETEEALALVDDLTARNLAVADLAFALLPADASSEVIAAALVPLP